MRKLTLFAAVVRAAMLTPLPNAPAQDRAGSRPPKFASPEVSTERKISFRIHAPKAEAVRLSSSDILNAGWGVGMKKAENGVWEASIGPIAPGAYRYSFSVDGVAVIDPKNPATSEANANTWSLVYVPGSEISDVKNVPLGAVSQVTYYSNTLKRFRRTHVYTPPGYDKGEGMYPTLYLLHGALDCDASWTTVGRAGFILDNLIAAGMARPIVVVMPAGHTGPFRFGPPGDRCQDPQFGLPPRENRGVPRTARPERCSRVPCACPEEAPARFYRSSGRRA